ncbi:MAG: D-alanyl-D-alanine carboxypeptidase family protein [Acidimicrobiales bacterium]
MRRSLVRSGGRPSGGRPSGGPPSGGRKRRSIGGRTLVVTALAAVCLLFGSLAGAKAANPAAPTAPPAPPIVLTRPLPAPEVVFAGSATRLAWPTHGEAAIAVSGLGTVGSSGEDKPVPIASVAKVMTAYLTLVDHPLAIGQSGSTYTFTKADVADLHHREALDQSVLPVVAGERLSEYQLLEGMLLPSGNNIAAVLARYDAHGSLARFVNQMNANAAAMGLSHTHYTDPSGFLPSTVSTALDQVNLARAAMANPVFAHIVDETKVTLPLVGKLANDDSLVGRDGFIGIKTGSDSQAEGCFTFADRKYISGHEVTIFGVVLGQGRTTGGPVVKVALQAGKTLADSVAAHFKLAPVLPSGAVGQILG